MSDADKRRPVARSAGESLQGSDTAESRRTLLLAETSALLEAGLDYESTLKRVTGLAISALADYCIIDIFEGEEVRRAAVAFRSPISPEAVEHITRNSRRRLKPNDPLSDVMRTGRTELISEITDSLLQSIAENEEELALARSVPLSSAIVAPLRSRSKTLGAITLVTAEPGRRFGPADVTLAEELAGQAALAVQNAMLFRDAAESARRSEETRAVLDSLLRTAPVGLAFLDMNMRYVRANDALAAMNAVDPIEIIGRTPAEVVPSLADEIGKAFRLVLETGEPVLDQEISGEMTSTPGVARWWSASFYPVHGPAGVIGVGIVVGETTDQKRAERSEAVRHATQQVLAEAATIADAVPRILESMCRALGWEFGAWWGVDRPENILKCGAIWPDDAEHNFAGATRGRAFPPGVGLPGRVWASGRPGWIRDVVVDENFPRAQAASESGLHGAFAFPLLAQGEVLGVIELFANQPQEPDEEMLAVAEAVGNQIGEFTRRRWIDAQMRFQKTLLESQSEATIDGVLVISPDGAVASYNQRLLDLWKLPEHLVEAGSGRAVLKAIFSQLARPDEFSARVRHHYKYRQERSQDELELADGRIFDRHTTPLIGGDGDYYGRAWHFRDITEQKNYEQRLRESNDRIAILAQASALLSASLHPSAILGGLARFIVPAMADWCCIDLLEEGALRRLAVAGADPEKSRLARRLRRLPPDHASDHPIAEVVRHGRPVILQQAELRSVFDSQKKSRTATDELGTGSIIVVPMTSRGATFGALTIASAESGRHYSDADVGLVEELGRRAGAAIDNARLFRDRSFVARTLQQSLLPPTLPSIPGAELAAFYHASGEANEVGGDFYDIFATGTDDWAIVIGDVCGKGAQAAATTALARHTIRAAAMQARKPSRVLATLNEAILRQRTEHRFCTVAYARIKPGRNGLTRATVAAGGHPLPLALRADGRVEPIGRPGMLVGIFDDFTVKDVTSDLAPGDALVMYTDGLTEARGRRGLFGEENLRTALESCAGMDAAGIAERVERTVLEFQAGDLRDDMALVVIRCLP